MTTFNQPHVCTAGCTDCELGEELFDLAWSAGEHRYPLTDEEAAHLTCLLLLRNGQIAELGELLAADTWRGWTFRSRPWASHGAVLGETSDAGFWRLRVPGSAYSNFR